MTFNDGQHQNILHLSTYLYFLARQENPKSYFSRLAQRLQGFNGEDLFRLSKDELDHMTNENESARLYALLSQQKQLAGVRSSCLFFIQFGFLLHLLQYRSKDKSEQSPQLKNNGFGSIRSNTINDADGKIK